MLLLVLLFSAADGLYLTISPPSKLKDILLYKNLLLVPQYLLTYSYLPSSSSNEDVLIIDSGKAFFDTIWVKKSAGVKDKEMFLSVKEEGKVLWESFAHSYDTSSSENVQYNFIH